VLVKAAAPDKTVMNFNFNHAFVAGILKVMDEMASDTAINHILDV